jgi:two-component system, NtrC family, nitrogen regulation response regulator NtrX
MRNSSNGFPPELAGTSIRVRDCLAQLQQAAADERGVLVVAERGLDGESVARALHDHSARRTNPFVVLTCAGGSQEVERAMFGGPARRRGDELEALSPASALARAHTGALFLDDVAELPAAAQRRLARVLRDGEAFLHSTAYRTRGGEPGARPSGRQALDVRVIGAATSTLVSAVDDGRLLDDLARRLPLVVDVPPLHQRREDVGEIAGRILAERAPGRQFTPAALTVLAALPWRRNVTELRALIDRLATLAPEPTIRQEEVLAEVQLDRPPLRPGSNLREARRQFEREHIASVLRDYGWQMREAARALGMERANLYRKARQLGIPLRRGAAAPARMR